jgi:hypothetical protein
MSTRSHNAIDFSRKGTVIPQISFQTPPGRANQLDAGSTIPEPNRRVLYEGQELAREWAGGAASDRARAGMDFAKIQVLFRESDS